MNASAGKTDERPDFPLSWPQAVRVAAVLLGASWALGQWPLDEWLPGVLRMGGQDLRSVSMGGHYLVAGALPWLLQWLGVASLVGAMAAARGARRRVVASGMIGPLIVGLPWWIGLAALFWHSDFVETQLQLAWYSLVDEWGGIPLGVAILFHVFGTMTCPLKFSGPFTMRGIDFPLTAVSTALTIAWLTWIEHKADTVPEGPRRSLRQFFVVAVGAMVWSVPIGVRAFATVLLHLYRLQHWQ